MKLEFLLKDKYDEGEAKGVSIGEAKERSRMVREMNANGISVQVIAKCASLDVEEVQKIIDCK